MRVVRHSLRRRRSHFCSPCSRAAPDLAAAVLPPAAHLVDEEAKVRTS